MADVCLSVSVSLPVCVSMSVCLSVCLYVCYSMCFHAAADNANCGMPSDRNSYDIWLSAKSSDDSSGSVFIYSYEEHECVSAKVVFRTFYISSGLSFQLDCIVSWSH